ncbi:type II secretion system F family protein [Planctomycetota bacterium]
MEPSVITPALVLLLGGLTLVVLGAGLLILVRIVSAPVELRGDESEVWALVILGRVLSIGGVAALFLSICLKALGLGVGIVGAIVCALVICLAVLRHRRARQFMLLSTLSVAAKRLMPLAPAVEAFADERWGVMGYHARRLAALLRSGISLPDALVRTPGLVSRQAQVTIRVGQESGALAEALNDVVKSHELHSPLWSQILGRVLYLLGLMLFACGVALFMMLRITPEFQKIFEEFDCALPRITQFTIATAHFAAQFGFILVPLLFLLILWFFALCFQYMAGVRWNLPLVNRLARRLDTAVILEALALAAKRNVGFQAAIETLARWYPVRAIRRHLSGVLADMRAGIDWSRSLALHGLIKPAELAVFEAAGRAGNLAWALREMAESNRRRLNYRLHNVVQLLFPMAILVFGLMVMVFVVSYFMPLVMLINNLS